ncbi:MAG: hypothetical protein PHS44_06715 [Candidatus Dojkabacteria bacterium]|nr:hypothetical protein [Candidatus Dojkabacteria bacterium]
MRRAGKKLERIDLLPVLQQELEQIQGQRLGDRTRVSFHARTGNIVSVAAGGIKLQENDVIVMGPYSSGDTNKALGIDDFHASRVRQALIDEMRQAGHVIPQGKKHGFGFVAVGVTSAEHGQPLGLVLMDSQSILADSAYQQ